MGIPPRSHKQRTASPGPADGAVQGTVRRLLREVAAAPPARPAEGAAPDVLLDVEVDGVRCLLIRLPPQAGHGRLVLSPREREIARMVAKGYPNKTIAGVLDISCWTVGTYLRRVFAKLGVCSRAAMVARLLKEGLMGEVPPPANGSSRPASPLPGPAAGARPARVF
jgi:DNA-binding CsgD family transcriptional regulator